jgi:hypothetical protein
MVIFKVTHTTSGRVYVGYSVNDSTSYLGSGRYITHALKQFGRDAFHKVTLEEFQADASLTLIMERLEYWIRYHRADDPKHGWNESIQELIPAKKRLTKKLQVLLTEIDEAQLTAIILEKSMEQGKNPISISKYVRHLLVQHIVEETKTENQFKIK